MYFKRILYTLLIIIGTAQIVIAQKITVASYNLRYDNEGDIKNGNGWLQRLPIISSLILFHEFDVFGTQEGLYHQLEDLKDSLLGFDYTGIGRDDGKQAGEHSAIFYNSAKFELVEHGDFWLSENTAYPNKGWDAVLPRICSWAKLRVIENGKTFYFFNVHFDHIGTLARKESAKLILKKISELAGSQATILTGDFNVDQNSDSYLLLQSSQVLKDAYQVSPIKYATTGTFNNFNANTKTESRIDHIFLTSDFKVNKYGVLTDSYRSPLSVPSEGYRSGNFPEEVSLKDYVARLPSDHFPVVISVDLPE